jgi:hypothetical protein
VLWDYLYFTTEDKIEWITYLYVNWKIVDKWEKLALIKWNEKWYYFYAKGVKNYFDENAILYLNWKKVKEMTWKQQLVRISDDFKSILSTLGWQGRRKLSKIFFIDEISN